MVRGIVYVIRNGLQWKDAPAGYGPHKSLYNRFIRWSRLGVFDRIFGLAGEGPKTERIMIDATHLKAHRTAASLLSKLHTVCDGEGRPIILLPSEGQMSDHKGARLVLNALPRPFICSPIAATTVPGSGSNSQPGASTRASPRAEAVKSHAATTLRSTATATRSRTSSQSSRTGGVSQPATTDAPTPSFPPFRTAATNTVSALPQIHIS